MDRPVRSRPILHRAYRAQIFLTKPPFSPGPASSADWSPVADCQGPGLPGEHHALENKEPVQPLESCARPAQADVAW